MTRIDDIEFFDRLAAQMNNDPGRYELLGDLELDLAVVMRRGDQDPFRVLLGFRGISCETVTEIADGEEQGADCWLDGDVDQWQAMFDDIATNGRAAGEWTLNTLTIMGERLRLDATDPMGWDKFHRFNQTLQEFFDAGGVVMSKEISDAST